MIRRIFIILAWISGLLLFLVVATLSPVDESDLYTQEYYQQTMSQIQTMETEVSETDFWLVGWSSENITPAEPVNLVGYKPRGEYEFVEDSSYVKSLIIGNGSHTVAYLNFELLIIHPYMADNILKAIARENLPLDQVVFTATHTHSGLGGYIPGIMGKVAFGGYEEEVVQLFTDQTIKGIRNALTEMDTATISYKKISAPDGVANRLIENGPIDPYLRQLIFEKNKGEKGTFFTYSAHATGLHSGFMGLSGDYPYYLNKYIEENGVDFSFFASGLVGSHRPVLSGREINDVKAYAASLNETLQQKELSEKAEQLNGEFRIGSFPMALPSPHFRITDNIRIRPWVFNMVFGETRAHFDVILLGNTMMVSSSGEISGVFYEQWERQADQLGLNLIITTFNGSYIGYITPDEHYHLNHHEVRDTHWFGPRSGSYFDEIFQSLISKVGRAK